MSAEEPLYDDDGALILTEKIGNAPFLRTPEEVSEILNVLRARLVESTVCDFMAVIHGLSYPHGGMMGFHILT